MSFYTFTGMEDSRYILIHRMVFAAIALAVIWTASNINWSERRAERIIKVDGNGYYAYLPALFIYHDLSFSFFEDVDQKYEGGNLDYEYRYIFEGDTINKYYAGTALAQLPFFLTADALTIASGRDRDGYSYLYLLFISLSALFYLFIAIYFFDRYLAIENIDIRVRTAIMVLFVFGTNIFYYAVYEPSMSHVYSLAFVAIFIFNIRKYALTAETGSVLFAGFALGMIVLIRPVNLLIILSLPFLLLSSPFHFNRLKRDLQWIPGLLIFFAITFIQFFLYKMQTGDFIIYSYGNEGFNFSDSRFAAFLVSYRKGLWVYTPVSLVAMAGLYYLWKRSVARAIMLAVFLILLVYVLASWHQWYYGGSYSSRVMVEYMPFILFLAALLLNDMKNPGLKWPFAVIFLLLILLNIVQTYQYYAGIIHWSDMNREIYWDIFLKLSDSSP